MSEEAARGTLMRNARSDLEHFVQDMRLVDTHEHLGLPPRRLNARDPWLPISAEEEWVEGPGDILQDLFGNYVQGDLVVAGVGSDAVQRLLDPTEGDIESRFSPIADAWQAARLTGFGEAVELAAETIYGLREFTPEALAAAQQQLEDLRRPGETLRLLRETAGLDHVQIDHASSACRADPAGPDFFLFDLSWWRFCNGEVDGKQVFEDTGIEVRSIDDLRDALAATFERFAPHAIAVKSQHAYQRTLSWQARSDDEAARALKAVLRGTDVDLATRLRDRDLRAGGVEETARVTLGDWCWARGVELAIWRSSTISHSRSIPDTTSATLGCPLTAFALQIFCRFSRPTPKHASFSCISLIPIRMNSSP